MTKSKKSGAKRILAAVLVAVMLCATMATTAFAVTNIRNFTWHQSLGKTTVDLGELKPGSNSNTSGIKFYAIGSSPAYGEFDVMLQRQGFMGIWFNVYARKGYQGSERKYDTETGTYVYGEPFLCVWPTNESGNYRVILENPTNPQETVFTGVKAWAYGS